MCLDIINEQGLNENRIGWNVYKQSKRTLYGEILHCETKFKKKTWHKATNEKIGGFDNSYVSGFHVFLDEFHAMAWVDNWKGSFENRINPYVIKKVKFRKGHTLGLQILGSELPHTPKYATVMVAKEIYIF